MNLKADLNPRADLGDIYLDHTSTLHANRGHTVKLRVRQRRVSNPTGQTPVVVMIHGRSVPAIPVFDFGRGTEDWSRYSWAKMLVNSGIDVFMMDQQGAGKSDHPKEMEDLRNLTLSDQLAVPNDPLWTDGPLYARYLCDTKTDRDELVTVLNWIAEQTGQSRVHLVGYSAGAFTAGTFAMEHPERVRSLFLLAPIFPPYGLSHEIPYSNTDPRLDPSYGFPLTVQAYDGLIASWNHDYGAEREPGIQDRLWQEIMDQDPVGADWGIYYPPGLIRIRSVLRAGWNLASVQNNINLGTRVPVAIVYGDADTTANLNPPFRHLPLPGESPLPEKAGPPFDVRWLYRAIQGPRKLMISFPSTGHFMPWETQFQKLHQFSADWIRTRSVDEQSEGSFAVPSDRDELVVTAPFEERQYQHV